MDTALLVLAGATLVGLFIVRYVWVGMYMPVAIAAFQDSDAQLPWFTRLTISSMPFYGATALTVLFAIAGIVARSLSSKTVGRTLLALAIFAGVGGAALDVAGVGIALRTSPKAASAGATTPCPCNGPNACAADCACACNTQGWIVEQTFFDTGGTSIKAQVFIERDATGAMTSFEVDGDGDGHRERRCVYDRPCPEGGPHVKCQMRCETAR